MDTVCKSSTNAVCNSRLYLTSRSSSSSSCNSSGSGCVGSQSCCKPKSSPAAAHSPALCCPPSTMIFLAPLSTDSLAARMPAAPSSILLITANHERRHGNQGQYIPYNFPDFCDVNECSPVNFVLCGCASVMPAGGKRSRSSLQQPLTLHKWADTLFIQLKRGPSLGTSH